MHTHFLPLCVIPFQVQLELKSFIIHCSLSLRSQLNRREEKEEVNGHGGENGLDNGEDGDVTVERGQPFSASSSSSGRSSRPSSFRP